MIAINCMGEMYLQPGQPLPQGTLPPHQIPLNLNTSMNQAGLVGGLEGGSRSVSARVPYVVDMNSSIGGNGGPGIEDELSIDKNTLETLKGMYQAKEQAVNNEDFDEAKRIKLQIDRLKAISSHLGQLEERKRLAILGEDFDAAKSLKAELDRLKESAIRGNEPVQFPQIAGPGTNRGQLPQQERR